MMLTIAPSSDFDITPEALASMIGRSRQTVYRWMRTDQDLPAGRFRIGRQWYWPRRSVETWIAHKKGLQGDGVAAPELTHEGH